MEAIIYENIWKKENPFWVLWIDRRANWSLILEKMYFTHIHRSNRLFYDFIQKDQMEFLSLICNSQICFRVVHIL